MKFLKIIWFFLFIHSFLIGQQIQKNFHPDSIPLSYLEKLQAEFGQKKQIPELYHKQILIALSFFPELKDLNIRFRVKNRLIPLTSRPTFGSVFRKPSKRKYVITISRRSIRSFDPILLHNLSFNAQVGVLGHEISHVCDYNQMKFGGFLRLTLGQLSKKYLDKFEFNTDKICIEHGLGYQLLAWSIEVRQKLNLKMWEGVHKDNEKPPRERYMNPNTILRYLESYSKYSIPKN